MTLPFTKQVLLGNGHYGSEFVMNNEHRMKNKRTTNKQQTYNWSVTKTEILWPQSGTYQQ